MATAEGPRPTTVDDVLAMLRELAATHDANAISRKHLLLAQLIVAVRALPLDARHEPIAPADIIERDVNADGLRYVIHTEGDLYGFRVWDVAGDNTLTYFEEDGAKQLVRDWLSVIAAKESRRG